MPDRSTKQLSQERPQGQNLGAVGTLISPKSPAGLAFFNGYMPPIAIYLKDGNVTHSKYGDLDQVIKGLRATHKERMGQRPEGESHG